MLAKARSSIGRLKLDEIIFEGNAPGVWNTPEPVDEFIHSLRLLVKAHEIALCRNGNDVAFFYGSTSTVWLHPELLRESIKVGHLPSIAMLRRRLLHIGTFQISTCKTVDVQ